MVMDADTAGDPGQCALWGLGRVIMNEHPELGVRLIDLQIGSGLAPTAERLVAM